MKRSWKSRLLEFALWAALAIGTAGLLIYFTDELLPAPNF